MVIGLDGVIVKKKGNDGSRIANTRTIFNIIRKEKGLTRTQLADKTGLSAPSVSRILGVLSEIGYINENVSPSNNLGRKTMLISSRPGLDYSLGVQIDKNFIRAGIIDLANNLVISEKTAFECYLNSATAVLRQVALIRDELAAKAVINPKKIHSAGIAMPGAVNRKEGIQTFSPQLGWSGIPVRNIAEKILKVPVVIDNDLKFYAYGESTKGLEGNPESVTFLYIGSGVGAAHVLDGKVLKGSMNSAGEIGHVKIDNPGIMCDCGRVGCLQTHMTEGAMINKARSVISTISTSSEIFEYMDQGAEWAVNIVMELVNYAAITLGILVAVYDPHLIVLGGEIIEQNDRIFQAIVNRYTDIEYTAIGKHCKIVKSSMQGKSVILGAGIAAVDLFLNNFNFSLPV